MLLRVNSVTHLTAVLEADSLVLPQSYASTRRVLYDLLCCAEPSQGLQTLPEVGNVAEYFDHLTNAEVRDRTCLEDSQPRRGYVLSSCFLGTLPTMLTEPHYM